MAPAVQFTKLFINNEWVDSVSKKTFPVVNPADETVFAHIAEGDKADVDLAVAAAKKAFHPHSEWRRMDASARGALLYKLADLIEKNVETLAQLESANVGKPLLIARMEVGMSTQALRYNAGLADKVAGSTVPADGENFTMTIKEPVGVCGQILPWNAPVLMFIWKISTALAAGCTVVVKPAEQTPLTALFMASLIKEAGFPAGVVNVVTGYGPTSGSALTLHPDVGKIAFTGSTEVGRIIMKAASSVNLKRVTLELGGKSPLVIFDDADLDKAVMTAYQTIFMNSGQICVSPSRIFVQSGIYDKFVEKAVQLAKARKVGNPLDNVEQGPQVDKEMFTKVLNYIEIGKKEGARCLAGGARHGNKGYFVQPTVFADVKDDMTIAKEEIFGPVQSILKFETFEEVVERANNTNYGLASGVFTKDITKALAFAKRIEAGQVCINTYMTMGVQAPFGGYKDSGIGRELGKEGIEHYLEVKTIVVDLPKVPTF